MQDKRLRNLLIIAAKTIKINLSHGRFKLFHLHGSDNGSFSLESI